MKVIAINGSPKKNGNTAIVLQAMAEELAKENIEFEMIHVGKELIHGCVACNYCFKSEEHKCVFKNDIVNEVADKIKKADGIILGSPVYYSGIPGTMKSFLDRVFYTSAYSFKGKVGTAFSVARRTGGSEVFHQLCNYLTLGGMMIPSPGYWGAVYGRNPGEVNQDLEGLETMKLAAREMAWLLKKIETGDKMPLPQRENWIPTNFIR